MDWLSKESKITILQGLVMGVILEAYRRDYISTSTYIPILVGSTLGFAFARYKAEYQATTSIVIPLPYSPPQSNIDVLEYPSMKKSQ